MHDFDEIFGKGFRWGDEINLKIPPKTLEYLQKLMYNIISFKKRGEIYGQNKYWLK